MSETVIQARMLVCDWPGCRRLGGSLEWLHTDDGEDYCPRHWHYEGDSEVPGPDPEEEA